MYSDIADFKKDLIENGPLYCKMEDFGAIMEPEGGEYLFTVARFAVENEIQSVIVLKNVYRVSTYEMEEFYVSFGVSSIIFQEWSSELPKGDCQLVWCVDGTFIRQLRFYDAENESTFNNDGERDGSGDIWSIHRFDRYEPYFGKWPQWAIGAHKNLKR